MVVRRSPCFLLKVVLALYLLGVVFYFINQKKPLLPTPGLIWEEHSSLPEKDPHFLDQPDSYTLGPRYLPNQMTVKLPTPTNTTERVAAAFIVLVRNSELYGMIQSMRDVEETFNSKFNYPWVFLNEEPFTDEFVAATSSIGSGKTHYGLVDQSMWGYPDWIDQEKAARERENMKDLPYGESESYRHMCRFQSGFFWRHPLVLSLKLEYYWRVEPDVRYYCKLDYDPFLYMKQNNKKYAFNISFKEHSGTIPNLWKTIRSFVKDATLKGHNYFPNLATDSLYRFITDEEGVNYNSCHFWTNFEIAKMDLWHTDAYQSLFEYLDKSGGFFYERWGDAPVHSIFASLFLKKDEIHFFNDVGYKHSIYQHCPEQENLLRRCSCDPRNTLDYTDGMSCLNEYMDARRYSSVKNRLTVNEILSQ